jgi:excisionase family DNA binding protein
LAEDWIDVRDAAELLGVAPVRVRQLIAAGVLPAERWSGRWRIDPVQVDRLLGQDRGGRPYAVAVAWHALALLHADLLPPLLGRQQQARARQYAAEIAAGRVAGLRGRARAERGRIHMSLLPRLAERVMVSGAAAIPSDDPNRLVGGELVEGYVRASRWSALADEFDFHPGSDPNNVIVHVVDDRVWPFDGDVGITNPVLAAVDLLEHGDQRAARAARAILARAGRS